MPRKPRDRVARQEVSRNIRRTFAAMSESRAIRDGDAMREESIVGTSREKGGLIRGSCMLPCTVTASLVEDSRFTRQRRCLIVENRGELSKLS